MSRRQVLSDAEWGLIEGFMPSSDGRRGRRFRDHRLVVEGIIYRYRTGIAWRDLPAEFGPWQTVWKRHRCFAADGTWDEVLTALLTRADAAGDQLGCCGRLHDRTRPPARDEHQSPRGGLHRIT